MTPGACLGPREALYTPDGKMIYVFTSPDFPASMTLFDELSLLEFHVSRHNPLDIGTTVQHACID